MKNFYMLKKLDLFVFIVNFSVVLLSALLIFIGAKTGSEKIIDSSAFFSFLGAAIIFIRFLRDKDFKVKFYIGFIICTRVCSKIYNFIIENFATDLMSLMIIIIVLGFIVSIAAGWLYQLFKESSYNHISKVSLEENNLN